MRSNYVIHFVIGVVAIFVCSLIVFALLLSMIPNNPGLSYVGHINDIPVEEYCHLNGIYLHPQ